MRSTAVVKTFRLMVLPYWLLYYPGILVPTFIRDSVYNIVSKYRSQIFGRKQDLKEGNKG